MKVYILERKFNRDDMNEQIHDMSCYNSSIIGAFTSEQMARDAALKDKRKFLAPPVFNFKDPDEDLLYSQAQDDTREVYAEDYNYQGEWGEFHAVWEITELDLQEDK